MLDNNWVLTVTQRTSTSVEDIRDKALFETDLFEISTLVSRTGDSQELIDNRALLKAYFNESIYNLTGALIGYRSAPQIDCQALVSTRRANAILALIELQKLEGKDVSEIANAAERKIDEYIGAAVTSIDIALIQIRRMGAKGD